MDDNARAEPYMEDLCEKRLWIGNLDLRVNEYQLWQMVRVYGTIEKLDMLFHRNGPGLGQPRGFAFVTYEQRRDAIHAMNGLNGKLLGAKRLSVKFAKKSADEEKYKPETRIAALMGVQPETKLSIKTAIQSIEAKLKMMETTDSGEDFVINKLAANESRLISQYQTKQNQLPTRTSSSFRRRHPYHKRK